MRPASLRMAPVILSGALAVLAACPVTAQRREYTVGGGGVPWGSVSEQWVALDDTTVPGAIRPKELQPWENLLAGPDPGTNILGFAWHFGKYNLEEQGHVLGLNPRAWGPAMAPLMNLLDGNESTGTGLRKLVYYWDWDPYAFSWDRFSVSSEVYTLDLGVPLPVSPISSPTRTLLEYACDFRPAWCLASGSMPACLASPMDYGTWNATVPIGGRRGESGVAG